MDAKDAYIKQLENTISSLQKQVDNLTEMILFILVGTLLLSVYNVKW